MNKPITIAHVVSSLKIGGAERFVIDLCIAQQKRTMSPCIISMGAVDDLLVAEALEQKIPVKVLVGNKAYKQLQMLLSFRKQQVIHVHSPHSLKFMTLMLPIFRKKKVIYTRHGAATLKSKKWTRFHQFAAPYINAISFVSEESSKNFHLDHDWNSTPSFVIDNGVNVDNLKPIPTENQVGKVRLGSVGRMVELKNQICLLQAIDSIDTTTRKGIEVHFFGDGECAPQLKQFHQARLNDVTIKFHGMQRDRDQIYNSFDTLVVTSETEGLSIAIIEAMTYQRSVIATDVGGNPRLVEDNVNGWLTAFNNPEHLAGCIKQLMAEPALRNGMGIAGREKALLRFSIDATAKKYEQLYVL
ncbi:MAG: glycosyltransferase family 4 protein [Motiliproteus sp.]